jgi:hypothetical protein
VGLESSFYHVFGSILFRIYFLLIFTDTALPSTKGSTHIGHTPTSPADQEVRSIAKKLRTPSPTAHRYAREMIFNQQQIKDQNTHEFC